MNGDWRRLGLALGTFVLSALLALHLTPMVRRAALRFGVLDAPDGALKTQQEAVPYLGGIAVYLAFLVTLSAVFDFNAQLLGLLLGGTMMAMLGLFDDLRVLPAGLKLMGQMLAAWVMLKSGIMIELVALPEWACIGLTVLWLVGITNAINIIDVSDGLAAGTSAVALVPLAAVAWLNGNDAILMPTMALCGALLGFLRFNHAPAQIYLGDTGSLFIGFMLAALSMIGAYTKVSTAGALAPITLLCVPLLDITLVSLARLRKGVLPWVGSPDHFAIRLKARGWSTAQVSWAAMALSGVGAVVALLQIELHESWSERVFGAACALFTMLLVWLWQLPTPGHGAQRK